MRKGFLWVGAGFAVLAYVTWSVLGGQSPPGASDVSGSLAPARLLVRQTPTGSASPTAVPTHEDPSTIVLVTAREVHRQSTVSISGLGLQPRESFRIETDDPSGNLASLATGTADEHGSFGG